ncbi:hypothetical protein BMJ01_07190 [Staphylococcus saprophyticus]|nr:hypothetical protein BMJ01_07190 [Staphylococcus saprophyticus]
MIELTKDTKLLADLNKEVQDLHFQEYPKIFKPYNKEDIESFFDFIINNTEMVAELLLNNGKEVGYIIYQIKTVSENPFKYGYKSLFVDQICIRNNLQRKGFGKLTMEYLDNVAYKNDCDFIELDYWANNIKAEKFYEKLGYINIQNYMMKHI